MVLVVLRRTYKFYSSGPEKNRLSASVVVMLEPNLGVSPSYEDVIICDLQFPQYLMSICSIQDNTIKGVANKQLGHRLNLKP